VHHSFYLERLTPSDQATVNTLFVAPAAGAREEWIPVISLLGDDPGGDYFTCTGPLVPVPGGEIN